MRAHGAQLLAYPSPFPVHAFIAFSSRVFTQQVLSDDNKRAIYDRYGEAGLKGGMGGMGGGPGVEFTNPFDLFDSFFGGGMGGMGGMGGFSAGARGRRAQNGEDERYVDLSPASRQTA